MTTQYTSILKLALPVTGELSGSWGDVVNNNITSMVEQAIAGLAPIDTWTANGHTLTTANGVTSESRCAMLVLTDTGGALTGPATVTCPAASKIYIVKNSSGQTATITTAGGSGVAIPNGKVAFVFCDGANVVEAVTSITGAALDFTSLKGGSVTVTAILDEDNMVSDSATALATQQSIKAYVDNQISVNNDLSEILANGNTTGAQDIVVQTGGNITFADSSKASFGASADLQIYHDGTNSYIDDAGVGRLNIRSNDLRIEKYTGETIAKFIADGAVELNYNDSIKLTTTATGVDITGGINATGAARIGVLNTDTSLTTYGTGTLTISTNGGTNSGTITIAQGVNGNITLTPNGTGKTAVTSDLAFSTSYTETVFVVSGTTPALSPSNGTIQTWTLSGASTPTAGTWASGQSLTLMVDDGTAYTITWSSLPVVWKTNGGAAPTLNTSGETAIQLWKVDSTIYGARVGDA